MFSIKKNKDSPDKDKIRYLKTLNDEVLSKTQMALLAINDYEMRRSKIFIPKTSFILQAEERPSDRRAVHMKLKEDEEINISMLGDAPQYYKIDCRNKIFPLKFEFKRLKNGFRFMASAFNMFPSEGNCEFNFTVDKAMRININPKNAKNIQTFYISMTPKGSLGIMTMQYNFYNQMLDNIKRGQSLRIRTFSQLSPIKTINSHDKTPQHIDSPSFRLKTQESKMTRSRTTMTNFRGKNIVQAPNYQKLSHSRRILTTERRQSRIRETKERRDDFWNHKEKEKQLIHKASKNKQAIGVKQIKVSQQLYDRRILTRDITTFLYMHKLLSFIDCRRKEICQQIRIEVRITMYQNKFYRSLKNAYKKTCSIMPSKQHRDKFTVHSALYLLTRIDKPTAQKRATKVIISLINNLTPSLRMNETQDQATHFRRRLRMIQKVWRTKYNMRLGMIKLCAQRQVDFLVDTHKKFGPLVKDFKEGNILHLLCIQYIKQTTIKFNEIYKGYFKKKEELEDIRKMNESIKEKNKTRSKKQQMALLYIRPEPILPHYRYFRDLDILKGMIRNWFEIEAKKIQIKKNIVNKLT